MADSRSPDQPGNGGWRPVPDPTVLTTEQVNRLEVTMRNLIEVEIEHLTELMGAEITDRRHLVEEQFKAVHNRFTSLEDRTAEQKSDTKAALDAALAAQKEAVAAQTESSEKSINKSEAATGERIKAVEALLQSSSSGLEGKLDSLAQTFDQRIIDVKERVARVEDRKLGAEEQIVHHAQGLDNNTKIMGAIVGLILLVIAVGGFILNLNRSNNTNNNTPEVVVACADVSTGQICIK